jgi:hypothetical protein
LDFSPVVLVDGAVAGVWSNSSNKKLLVEIEPLKTSHTRGACRKFNAKLNAWRSTLPPI